MIGFALALCLGYRLKKSHNSREKTEDPGSFGLTSNSPTRKKSVDSYWNKIALKFNETQNSR